jgi:ferredoxin
MMQASGVDLIVAACNGKAQCSTCHVILPPVAYDALPRPSFAEEDLLDIAADATDYSRLACQCIIAPGLDGATITIPDRVVNRMDDDAGVPVPTLQLRAVSASAR